MHDAPYSVNTGICKKTMPDLICTLFTGQTSKEGTYQSDRIVFYISRQYYQSSVCSSHAPATAFFLAMTGSANTIKSPTANVKTEIN